MPEEGIRKDEWALVLDFLSHGHSSMDRSQPVAHVVGEKYFSILEVIIREDVKLRPEDRVYIGDKRRERVKYIKGRIEMRDLTAAARDQLQDVVETVVKKDQARFLDFFNTSGQITTRLHQLELLPGIGKKHLWAIISERKSKPFESFKDMKNRVPLLPNPEKMIVKRILEEIEGADKYRLFVPKMEKERDRQRPHFRRPMGR